MPVRVRFSTIDHTINGSESEFFLDLDSHADICVLGNNALNIQSPYPERTAIVSFADPSLGTVTKPILSTAFLYTTPNTGTSYILVVHQDILINSMNHSLLCPMQLCENDMVLNKCPKSTTENLTDDTHVLSGIADNNARLRIPLLL